MLKTVLKILVGFVFIAAFVPSLLATVVVSRALDSSFYIAAADSSGIYTSLTEVALDEVREVTAKSPTGLTKAEREVEELTDQIISEVIPVLLDEEIVKDIVDSNIINILGYLNGTEDELFIYIPKEKIEERTSEAVRLLFNDILPNADLDLPVCSTKELNSLYTSGDFKTLTCVPDFIKKGEINFQQISGDLKLEVTKELDEFLKGNNRISLNELLKQLDESEDGPQLEQTIQYLENSRGAILELRTVIAATWLVVLILLGIYFGVSEGSLVSRGRSTLFPIGIAAFFVAVLGTGALIAGNLLTGFITKGARGTGPELPEELSRLAGNLINGLFLPYLLIGFTLLILSVVGIVFIGRRQENSI